MQTTRQIIEQCTNASNNGTAHFGEIVEALLEVGVESYYADYRSHSITYYMPGDEIFMVEVPNFENAIAEKFDKDALISAIRGAQAGNVMCPEFKKLSQAAGCVGYMVWLTGKHVSYFGRNGETHIENFP